MFSSFWLGTPYESHEQVPVVGVGFGAQGLGSEACLCQLFMETKWLAFCSSGVRDLHIGL